MHRLHRKHRFLRHLRIQKQNKKKLYEDPQKNAKGKKKKTTEKVDGLLNI